MAAPAQSDPALSLTAGILVARLRSELANAHRTTAGGSRAAGPRVEWTEDTVLALIRWIEAGAPRENL